MKKLMVVIVSIFLILCCIFSLFYMIGANLILEGMKIVVPSEKEEIEHWQWSGIIDHEKGHIISYDVCKTMNCDDFYGYSPYQNLKDFQLLNENINIIPGLFYNQTFKYYPMPSNDAYFDWEDMNCVLFDGPVNVTSDYGPRGGGFHGGIDYGLYNWTDVYSPINGVVSHADFYGDWGYTITIQNNDYAVMFSHAAAFNVNVGDYVHAGDKVIESGGALGNLNTGTECWTATTGEEMCEAVAKWDWNLNGNSTGGHLHFEVRTCNENGCSQAIHPSKLIGNGNNICDWYVDNRETSGDLHNLESNSNSIKVTELNP